MDGTPGWYSQSSSNQYRWAIPETIDSSQFSLDVTERFQASGEMTTAIPPEHRCGDNTQLNTVLEPHQHDILLGSRNYGSNHAGTQLFRYMIEVGKKSLKDPSEMGHISLLILENVKKLDPPARFLTQINDGDNHSRWVEIDNQRVILEITQALSGPVISPQDIELVQENITSAPSMNLGSNISIKHEEDIKEETQEDGMGMGSCSSGTPSPSSSSISLTCDAPHPANNERELRMQQQIALSISCIGKSFHDSANEQKDLELMFKDITDINRNGHSGLLMLPGIVSSLCQSIVDLEERVSNKRKSNELS